MKNINFCTGSNATTTAISNMSEADFHKQIAEILEEDMSIDESFIWFYTLTMVVYDLDDKVNPCSRGRIKRWTDLANIWGRCAEKRGEQNLFALAIHKIHWGMYPKDFPDRIPIEMVEFLEQALFQDDEYNKGWRQCQYYREAFDEVVNQYRPIGHNVPKNRSSWYCKYIRNRTWLNVVYKGREAPSIDLSNYTRAEFVSAKKHAGIYAEYHAYEKVVTTLIPEAAKWDQSQWLNERFLYRQLKQRFGISGEDLVKCWDAAISFLIELWYYKKLSVEKLLRIKQMPDALMYAIWGVNAQDEVIKLFNYSCGRVQSAHTYLGRFDIPVHGCSWIKLKTSWIFDRCRGWLYAGELPNKVSKIRRVILDLEMGVVS